VKRKIAAFLVFIIILNTLTLSVSASRNAAPWDTPKFRNPNLHFVPSNGALAEALAEFYEKEAHNFTSPNLFNDMMTGKSVPPLTEAEITLAKQFREVFVEGFRKDTLSRVFPFNAEYLELVLNHVDFKFANGGYGGVFSMSAGTDGNCLAFISGAHSEVFVEVALHEVAHALSPYSELLASLFDEEFRNAAPAWKAASWERSTFFIRPIYYADSVDFWIASLTSQAEYISMINSVFEKYPALNFTASDFLTARQVIMRFDGAHIVNSRNELLDISLDSFRNEFKNDVTWEMLKSFPQRFYDALMFGGEREHEQISKLINELAVYGRNNEMLLWECVDSRKNRLIRERINPLWTPTTSLALVVLRHSAGLYNIKSELVKHYDYNGDGVITSADALMMLRMVAEG